MSRAYQSVFRSVNAAAVLCLMWATGASAAALEPDSSTAGIRITLHATDGPRLSATCYRPPRPGPRALILAHRYGASDSVWACFAHRLAATGTPVVTVDLRGHGESAEPLGSLENEPLGYGRDVLAAARYVLDSLGVRPDSLFLGGEGLGAAAAIWAGSRLERSPAGFLLFDPLLTLADLALLPILRGLDRPCLLVASEEDARVSGTAESIFSALRPQSELWRTARAGPRLSGVLARPSLCEGFADDVDAWMASGFAARGDPTP